MNHIICVWFILSWFAGITGVLGQPVTIIVRDADNQLLPGVTIRMTNLDDSTSLSSFTNGIGVATFTLQEQGVYIIQISHLSYQTVEKTISVKHDEREFEFRITERVSELGAFTVRATRPLIRQEDDKMIIDPEPLANTSSNTLEVLESTPGLFVDQDGNIYLSSATPAVVYINGREQKMSGQDIATILRSLPPGSVERIEVLRTPSTKYDASSSGGIVNIVLKKGVRIGRFGSVNADMNQGVYGNRSAGFTLNNSGDRSTMYLNATFSYNDMLEEISAIREMQPDTSLRQSAETRTRSNQGYIGYGISYEATDKLNLNYDGRLNLSDRTSTGYSSNIIETAELLRLMESGNRVTNNSLFVSLQQDFGMIMKLDTLGSEWDNKFGYSYNSNDLTQDYLSEYTLPFPFTIAGEGTNDQKRHFILLQSDLTWQLPLKIKLETGAKGTWQRYGSDADFFTLNNGTTSPDTLRTSSFSYRERINAGYAQASRSFGSGFLLKAGVRVEHTWMDGRQKLPADTNFLINRADWFPYVYLSRRVFSLMDVELRGFLIYRKTINRPGYQSLNPTIRFVDQFLYETGNPALKPQFTDNYEMNISFNDFPIIAFGRNYTKDIFSPVVYQDDTPDKAAVRTWDNIGESRETYFRVMLGIPPGRKYFFAVGSQYNMNEYDGIYENEPLIYRRGSWRFFTFHSLTLFGNTRITMNGFLMHNGNYNFYELNTFGMLNFGVRQTLLNQKLTISLNARDVLGTMGTAFELNQGSISTSGDRYTDSRRFGINVRYNFGIRTKEEKMEMFQMEMEE